MVPMNEKVHACIEPSRVRCTGLCVIPHPRKLFNAVVVFSCLIGVTNAQRLLAQKALPPSQSATEQAGIQGHSLKEWAKMLHRDEVPRAQASAAIPKIIELVQSDIDSVREGARDCLIAMKEDAAEAVPVLVKMLEEDRRVIGEMYTLQHIGSPAVPHLMSALESSEAMVRRRACRVLGRIDSDEKFIAERISELLVDDDLTVRKRAAQTLRYMPVESSKVLSALIAAIENPRKLSRSDLIGALRHQGPAAVPVLRQLLASEQQRDRAAAVGALTALGPSAAPCLPELMTLLSESDKYHQRQLVLCLKEIGPAAEISIPMLIKLLKEVDGRGPLTIALGGAIAKIDPDNSEAISILIGKLETRLDDSKRYLKIKRGNFAPSALGYAAPLMRHDEGGTYFDANDTRYSNLLQALMYFRSRAKPALPHVRRILQDDQQLDMVRSIAITVLTQIAPNDPATVKTLQQYARQSNTWVGKAARERLEATNNGRLDLLNTPP